MNDVYVGLFIIAAYTVFAAIWTGWWRGRAAFWVAMPVIGVLLGLALASKWVAAYAIGALLLLILVRSALGRVLAILGLIGITAVLGYMAISVPAARGRRPGLRQPDLPADHGRADPAGGRRRGAPPDRLDRRGDALRGRRAGRRSATLVFFGALATGRLDTRDRARVRWPSRRCSSPSRSAFGSLVVVGLFWLRRSRWGSGRSPPPPAPDDPIRLLDPPGDAARGLAATRLAARASRSSGWRALPGRPARSSCTSSRTSRGR